MHPIRDARRAAHGEWMERAASAGLAARGVLYAIIGASALLLSLGEGGGLLDRTQAQEQVRRQPYGDALLVVLGLGLACYGVWRIAQGAFGHGHTVKRVGRAASGAVHLAFAVSAFQSAAGGRAHGRSSWVHRVLDWEGGRWIVIATGVGFVGAGLYQLYRAYTGKFEKELDTGRMTSTQRRWAMRVGRFGLAARGAVFPILGWLLIRAGRDVHAAAPRGTGTALREIAVSAWGGIALPVIAAGLLAYAVYLFVQARFHRDLMRA